MAFVAATALIFFSVLKTAGQLRKGQGVPDVLHSSAAEHAQSGLGGALAGLRGPQRGGHSATAGMAAPK
jgi:hypothetical protein